MIKMVFNKNFEFYDMGVGFWYECVWDGMVGLLVIQWKMEQFKRKIFGFKLRFDFIDDVRNI